MAKSQDPKDAASEGIVRALRVQDLDVPVRSVHADPLSIPDALGGVVDADDGGQPYSRATTAPWVITPPTSVTRPSIATLRRRVENALRHGRGRQFETVWW